MSAKCWPEWQNNVLLKLCSLPFDQLEWCITKLWVNLNRGSHAGFWPLSVYWPSSLQCIIIKGNKSLGKLRHLVSDDRYQKLLFPTIYHWSIGVVSEHDKADLKINYMQTSMVKKQTENPFQGVVVMHFLHLTYWS